MTPQERDLLTNLVTRLRQAPQQQRDSEAASMIDDLVRERPDTPYVLAQTVLIQDYSLHQAQARIAELEQQLQSQQGHESGGFLSAIFGSSKPAQGAPPPRPQPQPQTYQQPAYAQAAPGPWGQGPAPGPAQQVFAQAPSQPSFLRSAATTAAGIAGGTLLFQGIESLFGGRGGFGGGFGGAGYGGFVPQPGITETVVNNYYEEPKGDTQSADFQRDDYQQADYSQGQDDGGVSDASYDDSGFDDGGGFDGSSDV